MSESGANRSFGEMWQTPESRQSMLAYYRLAVNLVASAADYVPFVGSELAFSDTLLKVFSRVQVAEKVAKKASKIFKDLDPLPKTSIPWKIMTYGVSKIPFAPGRLMAYGPTFNDDFANNRFADGARCFGEGFSAIGKTIADQALALFQKNAETPEILESVIN